MENQFKEWRYTKYEIMHNLDVVKRVHVEDVRGNVSAHCDAAVEEIHMVTITLHYITIHYITFTIEITTEIKKTLLSTATKIPESKDRSKLHSARNGGFLVPLWPAWVPT